MGLNAMERQDENWQVIYQSYLIRDGVRMNMLRFAIKYFMSTTLIQNRGLIKDFCKAIGTEEANEFVKIAEFSKILSDSLIDSIKLTICFENYMKSILLFEGYSIHTINQGDNLKQLKKFQKASPVKIKDIFAIRPLTADGSLYSDGSLLYSSSGIGQNTIQISTLLNYKNAVDYKLDPKVLGFIEDTRDIRNTLHYLHTEGGTFTKDTYSLICKMIDAVNENIILPFNKLASIFKNGDNRYLAARITY